MWYQLRQRIKKETFEHALADIDPSQIQGYVIPESVGDICELSTINNLTHLMVLLRPKQLISDDSSITQIAVNIQGLFITSAYV